MLNLVVTGRGIRSTMPGSKVISTVVQHSTTFIVFKSRPIYKRLLTKRNRLGAGHFTI
jgi:hypothetical protein